MIVEDSVYGQIEFNGAIEKIIHTKPLQRLKQIHQGGAVFLAYPHISTSRFEHSLGVCHLITILGGNQREQIAGLLHDISHTAFSHVIDYVLQNNEENFHEHHKRRFLSDREIAEILNSLRLAPEEFVDDCKFSLLETELPGLCADRIDYTLRDLVAWGKVSQPEVQEFLKSLEVVNRAITINSIFWGQWFKNNYEYLNQYFFRDAKNVVAHSMFTDLLRKALQIDVLQIEDFFQDDNFVIDKINNHKILKAHLEQIEFQLKKPNSAGYTANFRNRAVDPLILENGKVMPLSQCI